VPTTSGASASSSSTARVSSISSTRGSKKSRYEIARVAHVVDERLHPAPRTLDASLDSCGIRASKRSPARGIAVFK
jgi:hypothetical protein